VAEGALTPLARTLSEALALFPADLPFALIGGLAVSARTEPRFTRDVDFAIAVASDQDAEMIVHSFLKAGFLSESVLENPIRGRLATMRLRRNPRAPIVDLLFLSSGIEAEIAQEASPLAVLGQRVPVARIGHLIAMKLVARDDRNRPADQADLRALSKAASEDEWECARVAVDLIHERGFDRGRDLRSALADWRRQARDPSP